MTRINRCVSLADNPQKIDDPPSNIFCYYINTNEIPGELSRENMISSHVKITCYFHMWKYHRCYGYIINHAFRRIKLFQWMVWYFIGVYIINRTLHGRLEIRNFSSRVENISPVTAEKFLISTRPCNILCFVVIVILYLFSFRWESI